MNKVLLLGLISIFMVGCASTASDSEIEHFETVGWNQNKKLMVVRQVTHFNEGGNVGLGITAAFAGPLAAVAYSVATSGSDGAEVDRDGYLNYFKNQLTVKLGELGVETSFVEQPDIYGHDEWFDAYTKQYSEHEYILEVESWVEYDPAPVLSRQEVSVAIEWTIYNKQGLKLKQIKNEKMANFDKEVLQNPAKLRDAIFKLQLQNIDEFAWTLKYLGQ